MDERNFLYLFFGLSAVWAILAGYVIFLGTRESTLRSQLENLKRMVEDQEK